MKIKIGIGYDVHKLVKGKSLNLGGIEIPFSKRLLGHSDGDCLIHAIADAVLGAEGRSDIGQLFPDTDPEYKNISSRIILKEVVDRITERGFEILSIDTIIIAEKPKISSYIPEMKNKLCSLLKLDLEDLGIKAKTNEGIGEIGSGRAIAAWAAAVLMKP